MIKIKKDTILYVLLIIPFLEPLLYKQEEYAFTDSIFSICKICSFLLILLLYILQNKWNTIVIVTFAFEAVFFLSTLINKGDVGRFIGPCVSVLGFILITDYFFVRLKISYLKINIYIMVIQTIINLIVILRYPNGITLTSGGNKVYFLGIGNRFVFTFIPLLVFMIAYSILVYNKISKISYLVIIVCLYSTIFNWSVGGTIGLFLICISSLLIKYKWFNRISPYMTIVTVLILNVLLVYYHAQNIFANFIEIYLKKDVTLTGRIYLWDNGIKVFKQHSIYGVGIQNDNYLSKIYLGVKHPHNLFLNYLVQGGIIAFIIFIIILFMIAKKIDSIKNYKLRALLNTSIFVILFLSLTDTLDSGIFFMMYIFIYNFKEILENNENRNINIS